MGPKIIFDKSSLPFILRALDIKTDIPLNKIGGIYKGKIYTKDIFSIIELAEELKKK